MDIERARDLLRGKRQEFIEVRDSMADPVDVDGSQQEADSSSSSIDQSPADLASQTDVRTNAMPVDEDLESRIASIDGALHRIDAGDYGKCEICAEAIDQERLDARPDERYCRRHQSAAELDES